MSYICSRRYRSSFIWGYECVSDCLFKNCRMRFRVLNLISAFFFVVLVLFVDISQHQICDPKGNFNVVGTTKLKKKSIIDWNFNIKERKKQHREVLIILRLNYLLRLGFGEKVYNFLKCWRYFTKTFIMFRLFSIVYISVQGTNLMINTTIKKVIVDEIPTRWSKRSKIITVSVFVSTWHIIMRTSHVILEFLDTNNRLVIWPIQFLCDHIILKTSSVREQKTFVVILTKPTN